MADGVAERLGRLGLTHGGRVGLCMRRSAGTIAAMLGTLRAGSAYVPVDPYGPAQRTAGVFTDCQVDVTLVEESFEPALRQALDEIGGSAGAIQVVSDAGMGSAIGVWLASPVGEAVHHDDSVEPRDDLACFLYTSGTTGRPKGWMMSRVAIEAHAAWSHRFLAASRSDVFANHAPFSFGMSLFDIYSSLSFGSPLVLVPDALRQHARFVVDILERERVSIWFSGPAVLSLIAQLSDLEARDLSALRVVAFAGEVFPLPHLNALRRRLPQPSYFNFYGSTETNVAAYHELTGTGDLDDRPPIGRPCEHYDARIVGIDGELAASGAGELQLRGPGLTTGYWNDPAPGDRMAPSEDGAAPWFRTRDLVAELPSGDMRFMGRIGRMVKLRGYRVEPGEIESWLYQHESIKEAGVVPAEGPSGLELVAHLSTSHGGTLPTVALKEFCAIRLPAYMIPARFEFHASLPKTSSGKIDFQRLRSLSGTSQSQ
jgi:amino acid adenylation domain-containing protein